MKDVLKRLAELDSKNPNRPEYKVKTEQVIPSSPGTMPKPSGSGPVMPSSPGTMPKPSGSGPVMPSRPGTMPRPSGSGNVLPQKTEKIGQEIEFLRTMIKFDEDALEQHMDDYPDLKLRPASSSHVNFLRNRIAQNQARLQKLETVYQKKATPMLPGTQTKYNLQNPNINECGMSYGSSMMDRPSTPASINITAGSGSELSSMLKDIMSLAGMSKQEPISSPVATVEPDMDDGTTVMRSVMDKLNPKVDAPENEGLGGALGGAMLGGAALGPLGAIGGGLLGNALTQETDEPENEGLGGALSGAMLGGAALGPLGAIGGGLLGNELTKETDEPENEGLAGTMLGGAAGAALTRSPGGAIVGAHVGDEIENSIRSRFSKDSEDNLEEYSNTPKDPTNVPPIGRDAMLNKSMHNQDPAGHPQKGKRMNGTMPRAHADEMYESLMKEYKKFINESRKEYDWGSDDIIEIPKNKSDFKHKNIRGLYNFKHYEHPDGSYIQIAVHDQKGPRHGVYRDEDGNHHNFNSFDQLKFIPNKSED